MIIVNVDTIAYIKPREGSYDNDGRLKQSVNIEVFAAKDITVRGDGSLGVEAWLQQVAKNAEGGEQDD
jgi:hypothetical protein